MPPRVFSILTSPILVAPAALTFLSSSRLAGMHSLRTVFRSGSLEEEYGLEP